MLDRFRRWRESRRLATLFMNSGLVAVLERLSGWPPAWGRAPWPETAERLIDLDRDRDALSLLEHAPESVDVLLVRCALERSLKPGSEVPTLKRLRHLAPTNEAIAVRLAEYHLEAGDDAQSLAEVQPFAASLSPRTQWVLARAAASALPQEKALETIRPFIERVEFERMGVVASDDDYRQTRRLYDDLLAQHEGAEALTMDLLRRGQLDPRSGVNHRELAKGLMVGSKTRAAQVALQSIEQLDALSVGAEPTDIAALIARGEAALRREAFTAATAALEAAQALDPNHFAPALGLAFIRDCQQRGLFKSAWAVPELPRPDRLEQVVPDWPALSRLERRVVLASTWPVSGLISTLAAQGCTIRLLPLAVRPSDLPELAELEGLRVEDDHRSWEGLEGMAAERLAVTRIDALFDTTPDGLTFAHELAHLAERVLPLRLKLELARLYDEAQSHEHAFEQYSLRNVHEFFAVHATHALTRRLGRPLNLEFDADGQLKRVLDFFEEVRRG